MTRSANREDPKRWPWQRALVTGASGGIGEAFALELAAAGCDLILVARRRQLLEQLAARLARDHGVCVEVLQADLTDAADLARVEARVTAEDGPDLLVNNAGGGQVGELAAADIEAVEAAIRLNVLALVRLTHAAIRSMRARGRGTVVNLSSGLGFYPLPYAAIYAAAKAFVTSLSEALTVELRGSGVSVTTVCPGFTPTEGSMRSGFDVSQVPRFLWTDARYVARAGLDAAAQRQAVFTPGLVNRIGAAIGRHAPHHFLLPFLARFTRVRAAESPARGSSSVQKQW